MKKKYYILRHLAQDEWIQFKGTQNTLTTNTKNIHIFTEHSLEERLAHAKRMSSILGKPIVSEDW